MMTAGAEVGARPRRPEVVYGYTRQIRAPEGKVLVTINSDAQGPMEVFVTLGKAGSDLAAMAEALGRLISLCLQLPSPLSRWDRAREIADQLEGIGGSRSTGYGPNRVRSLPDAVARAILLHLEVIPDSTAHCETRGNEEPLEAERAQRLGEEAVELCGDLCPGCGCHSLVAQEGCCKCVVCGQSEC